MSIEQTLILDREVEQSEVVVSRRQNESKSFIRPDELVEFPPIVDVEKGADTPDDGEQIQSLVVISIGNNFTLVTQWNQRLQQVDGLTYDESI
jgi:hypothetical protein